MVSEQLEDKDKNNELKRIDKLERQVERLIKHILKGIQMFENTLQAMVCADKMEGLKGIDYYLV